MYDAQGKRLGQEFLQIYSGLCGEFSERPFRIRSCFIPKIYAETANKKGMQKFEYALLKLFDKAIGIKDFISLNPNF